MRTAEILFSISGLVFIIVGIVSGEIGVFLPIGIALVVVSMGLWQRSRKPINNEQENSSE
jgi:membrane-bound ClpP family serine protease